ncbi:DNA helicase Rep [Halospina sp. K52047b]|uniref:DNA helicase Rep n=1 Tax=Halospina sp. K52047b TaxID=2614160 RepID=UPI001249D3FA|nr:DNA helicase Rep [Halospina sp. K52047b]KAA8981317.1 DNA helicase Rep [Halospina sp. K52047b]
MADLNPRQREAVKYLDGPLLVLAGAGSGKTSVITRKIAHLIEYAGYPGRHIAAVTFTNKAAREMKERVSKLVDRRAARGLTVATFHNLGLTILREEHDAVGYHPGFSIFDAEDARNLLRDLLAEHAPDTGLEVGDLQTTISNWKNAMLLPDQALSRANDAHEERFAVIYQHYADYLKAYNALDFDDLILLPVLLFRNHEEVLQKWQRRIRYLLVDEYQDTNLSQYELVRLLVGHRQGLTVVGDDDQSIYAWRGARPENLAQLKEDFPSLKIVKLEQNYRSMRRILSTANTVIANNPHVFDKALWSELGVGDPIRVLRCRNEEGEAERIASEILDQRLRSRSEYRDFAVLYRGNHQSKLLEIKLQAYQIPYKISGGTSFFARNEIKDAMAYLRLLTNPDDDVAFLRVVNVPRREIGPRTLEQLTGYARQRQMSLVRALDEVGADSHIQARALEKLRRFTHFLHDVRQQLESGDDTLGVIRRMFTEVEYEEWLHQNASSAKQAQKRMENVWYLLDSIEQMEPNEDDGETEQTLEEAVSRLVLRDILDRQEEEDDSDRVQLMTLHASKGLEFPNVFIMGLEEELLPHRSSIESETIEEERRLMYVGITRAQRCLTLTYAGQRKQYGEVIEPIPSRFLDEMPDEHVEREGSSDRDPDANQRRGRATLSALMDDLS